MWRLVSRFIKKQDEKNSENKGTYENYLRDSLHIVLGLTQEFRNLGGYNMRKLVSFIVALNLAFLTLICAPTLGQSVELGENITPDNSTINKNVILQVNESKPQPVNLFLYGSVQGTEVEGKLSPMSPSNTTENFASPAWNFGGRMGTAWLIGIWSTNALRSSMSISGDVSIKIWAIGTGTDVFFGLNFLLNGNDLEQDLWTDKSAVSGDTEFRASGILTVDMNVNDVLSVRVYGGTSASPDNNWEMVWGNPHYDTHVRINCAPIVLEVTPPIVTDDFVTFLATAKEAFGTPLSALNPTIRVSNHADVETLDGPNYSEGGNGTIILWIWNYRADEAHSEDYTVTVILSYDGENEFLASGIYFLELPEETEEGGLGWLMPVIIIIVIIVVIVVVVKMILGRRSGETSKT